MITWRQLLYLERNFGINFGRAAWETCSETWNFNSFSFGIGPMNTPENLDVLDPVQQVAVFINKRCWINTHTCWRGKISPSKLEIRSQRLQGDPEPSVYNYTESPTAQDNVHRRSASFRRGRHCLLSVIQQLQCQYINANQPANPRHSLSAYVTLCLHGSPPALL
jgi:hypothetical protein